MQMYKLNNSIYLCATLKVALRCRRNALKGNRVKMPGLFPQL
jgi:hypothetical protein